MNIYELHNNPDELKYFNQSIHSGFINSAQEAIKIGSMFGRRIPEWEPNILEEGNAQQILDYATQVIKGRWPEGEKELINIAKYSIDFAERGGNPHDMQNIIAYALHVIKGRWKEVEPVLMQFPKYAGWYANDVLKRRWPEAESSIIKDGLTAGIYAMKQGKRWKAAEDAIRKGDQRTNIWLRYEDKFLDGWIGNDIEFI